MRLATVGAKLLVTDQPLADLPILSASVLLTAQDGPENPAATPEAEGLAYLQFSSGSTGAPKGIGLSWAAIRSNLEAMARRLPINDQDRAFSWLPLYHDMGLFGGFLLPLMVGAQPILMDPTGFTRNPVRWLKLLAQDRTTVTVTPPSALWTVLQLLERSQLKLDLSALTKLVVGSEPVSPRLLAAVSRGLVAQCGMAASALKPVYGLAEATLAVTMPTPTQRPTVDQDTWVGAGPPLEGTEVRIIDPNLEGVGAVWIKSPSLTLGLMTSGVLTPRAGEWLDTGDLGYVVDQQLYLVGRTKDIIIKKGRNYAPASIEEGALQGDGVRRAVAFGIDDPQSLTERVIILVETRPLAEARERDQLRLRLRSQLAGLGFEVDEVHVVAKGSIPMTTSGKVRRQEAKTRFLQGAYRPSVS